MTTIRPFDFGLADSTINQVPIHSISWTKFKGKIPDNPSYFAHIYWNIDYRYYFNDNKLYKPIVVAKPYISGKSWVIQQKASDKLLRHEYGHYLIGCLCALKFQQSVNNDVTVFQNRNAAIKLIQQKFQQNLKEYLQIQKQYDQQTEHYYNQSNQQKWENWIANQINNYATDSKDRQKDKQKDKDNDKDKQKQKDKNSMKLRSHNSTQKTDKNTNSNNSVQKHEIIQRKILSLQKIGQNISRNSSVSRNSSKQNRRQISSGKYKSSNCLEINTRNCNNCNHFHIKIRKNSVNYPPLPKIRQITSIN